MRKNWLLILILESIHGIADEESCANIVCHHDNVKVCGVRGDGSGEVAFRLFRDACALQIFRCQEGKIKDFKLVDIDYCKQAFSVNTFRRSSANNNGMVDETSGEGVETNIDQDLIDTADNNKHNTCIQCACTSESKSICAIRPEGDHFIIRWFPDECHMRQYNCENNFNFSVTDDYICVGHNYSKNSVPKEDEIKNTDNAENKKPNLTESLTCLQNVCFPDIKVICAIRPENERFRVRWFDNNCDMLKYNCENHVNFSVTEDFICIGNDSSFEVNKNPVKPQIIETDDIIDVKDISELQEISEEIAKGIKGKDLAVEGAEDYELKNKWNHTKRQMPDKVVVSTFDVTTENINQTVEKFFAASHSTGIVLQKLGDEETRRMIVKNTGPVKVYIPRTIVPENYTLFEENLNKTEKLKYAPLVQYCFHKCPEKCPEIYKPVCLGRGGDTKKQSPFIFLKNHCYMDLAKCMTSSYEEMNKTSQFEEVGFLFCGGYKMMNRIYMFPLIRILQKMGRLKKKGKAHFVMRDLGYFPERLQG